MPKRIQVVLNEYILSLGKDGDLVGVAPGYAHNFVKHLGKTGSTHPRGDGLILGASSVRRIYQTPIRSSDSC